MRKSLKYIYKLIPFKKQLFIALRCFWKPKERIYKHLHFIGVIKLKINSQQKFKIKHYGFQVENDLFWSGLPGNWEKKSLQLWINLCKESNVILDIGANTGIYALIAKTINPNAKVYAFEPVKRVYEKLTYNNSLNNYDISCIECALSNSDGTAIIYDTNAEHTYSVTVNKNLNTTDLNTFETKIQTKKLSTFIEKETISKIDLIKIDVESHEPEVLEGMGEYLEKMRPTVLIEILNNEIGTHVQKYFENKGYLYFKIDGEVFKTNEIRIEKNYCNYLICTQETAKNLNLL